MPTTFTPRPAMQLAHPMIRPNLMLRSQRMVLRGGRFGPGTRRGAFAFDGVGLGLAMVSDLAAPPRIAAGYGLAPEPVVIPAIVPPPCPRPLIIKVGLGLRHVARTRVIYGTPTTCLP